MDAGSSAAAAVTLFKRDLYRHGLLGRFIGAAHLVARMHGANPRNNGRWRRRSKSSSCIFDTVLAPLFDRRLVRWLTAKKTSLYGLGIPPAQYEALSRRRRDGARAARAASTGSPAPSRCRKTILPGRLSARGYASGAAGPLPPYLRRENFEDDPRPRRPRRGGADAPSPRRCEARPPQSFDAYVLLDAQDWMTDAQLNALWSEITRTASPGARVVFRTAAEPTLLAGRVDAEILGIGPTTPNESRALTAEDRSSIYGGFHLYRFNG